MSSISRKNNEDHKKYDYITLFTDNQVGHFFDELPGYNPYDISKINLVAGSPGPDLFEPLPKMFAEATQHRMQEEMKRKDLFQYGPSAGLWGMRNALAGFLSHNYGDVVKRESLILTCGATHGIHLLMSTILAKNGVVFVEEYTYALILKVFKEFQNIKVIAIPMKNNVIDVEKLKKIASNVKRQSEWSTSEDKPFWGLLYIIPVFQNPTGSVLSPDKCKRLLDVARELDLLLVCDDVYNLIHFGPKSPKRLFAYDKIDSEEYKGGHVVSNGTFSKIMCTGMRVGWMEVPPRLALRFRQSGLMQSGGAVNNVMFGIVQSLIELGYAQKQLDWYRKVFKNRMNVVCEILRQKLPRGCKFSQPVGGYFLWVETPVDAGPFLEWCKETGGPIALPATTFRWSSSTQQSKEEGQEEANKSKAFRISIGFQSAEVLKTGIEVLVEKLDVYLKNPSLQSRGANKIRLVSKL